MDKERYECKYNEKLMKHYSFDNENKEELGYKGVVRVLNQQNKQIKELNTKLVEEMELSAERRQIIEDLTIENNQQDKEIEELKEKYNKLYECYKKTASEDLKDKYDLAEKNEELKAENKRLKEKISTQLQNNADNVDFMENQRREIEQLKQSQNQKAIEELEKLKSAILSERNTTYFKFDNFNKGKDTAYYWANEIIDNQIKSLRGEE